MAENEIVKNITLPFFTGKLAQPPSELDLFQSNSQRPADTTYQTALKRTLNSGKKRESRSGTTFRERETSRRAVNSSRTTRASERGSETPTNLARAGQASSPKQQPETSRSRPATPRPETRREVSSRSSREVAGNSRTNTGPGSATGFADSPAGTSSGNTAGETSPATFGPEKQNRNAEGDSTLGKLDKTLETLNQAVAELVESQTGSLPKPPASLSDQFSQPTDQDDSDSDQDALTPEFFSDSSRQTTLVPPGSFSTEVLSNENPGSVLNSGLEAAQTNPEGLVNQAGAEAVSTPGAELPGEQVTETANGLSGKPVEELASQVAAQQAGNQQALRSGSGLPNSEEVKPEETASQPGSAVPGSPLAGALLEAREKAVAPQTESKTEPGTEPGTTGTEPQNVGVTSASAATSASTPGSGEAIPEEKAVQSQQNQATDQPVKTDANGKAASQPASLQPVETFAETENKKQSGVKPTGAEKPEVPLPHATRTTKSTRTREGEDSRGDAGNAPLDPEVFAPKTGPQQNVTVPALGTATTVTPGEAGTGLSEPVATSDTVQTVNGAGVLTFDKPVAHDRAASRAQTPQTTLPPASSSEFLERFSDSVRVAEKNNQQLRVRLTPPQLGSMQIEVTKVDGVVTARLEVQSSATQKIIMEQLSGLKEILHQQGNTIERIDVQVHDPNQPDQSRQQGANQQEANREHGQNPGQQNPEEKQNPEGQQTRQEEKQTEPTEESSLAGSRRGIDNIDVEI